MMGSMASTRSGPCRRTLPRSAISAIMVPRMVVPVAVSRASMSVFQATPQRTPPATQPTPQLRSLAMRVHSAGSDHAPSSVSKAACSAFVTG